jgi:hypothetical protein
VFLGGEMTMVNDLAISEALTPGMGVERFNSGGVIRWRKAPADVANPAAVLLDQPELNLDLDDNYAVGDLAKVAVLHKGGEAWMLVASGQNIAAGDVLGNAGDGTLKTGATVALYSALENKATVTVLSRIRVEAL